MRRLYFTLFAMVLLASCQSKEKSQIYVKAVEDISDSFIRGMDASSVLAEENSGVRYYGYDGREQDIFKTFAESGITYIRLRVWNDPFDEDGRGYGGGNNDVATAIELGKRASRYGMKLCIDFHYSDFWADPKRQHAPKAWQGMDIEQKAAALHDFTKESLESMLKAGLDIGMVQVGNEINFGMAGETAPRAVVSLLQAGSRAVREVAKKHKRNIQIAVHYTKITEPDRLDKLAAMLKNFELDYDIFALSYYPFWDGPLANMQETVSALREKYGKKLLIAETSYCYTAEDGDGFANSLSGTNDIVAGYPATVQGQARMIRDVIAAAHEAGAIGVFYWEGGWIPVGKANEDNASVWEKYGSGWASSYAAKYDPEDAGLYYGGSSWDNQAFFDFDGHPLASLKLFKQLKHGAEAPLAIDAVPDSALSCTAGKAAELPETVDVIYNNGEKRPAAVKWNEGQLAQIDWNKAGEYTVTGSLEDGSSVNCQLSVILPNFVQNPSFEDEDRSMWKVVYEGKTNPTDYQKKPEDARSGDTAFHFYSDSAMSFSIEQECRGLPEGIYRLSVSAQGGDMASNAVMELYARTADKDYAAPFMVTSWADWKTPVIPAIELRQGTLTIGVRIKGNARSWGTVDDFTLNRVADREN